MASTPTIVATLRRLIAVRRLPEALDVATQWTQVDAGNPRAWYGLAELAERTGDFDGAAQAALQASRTDPSSLELALFAARALFSVGRRQDALNGLRRACPDSATSGEHQRVGLALSEFEAHDAALHHLRLACAGDPSPQTRFNLATAARNAGAISEARAVCRTLIDTAPQLSAGWYLYADLRRATPADNHVSALHERLADPAIGWEDARNLHFALAQELEALDRHAEAFAQLSAGNALHRRHLRYDVQRDLDLIQRIRTLHTPAALQATTTGASGVGPIFIMGLPRSGTTLVEQVLGSHSQVRATGERNEFTLALAQVGAAHRRPAASPPDPVRDSLALDMGVLGRRYLRLMAERGAGRATFTDKKPQNALYAGIIARALPGARLVLVDRDPRDVGFAIYKTLFGAAYPFAYDLDDLARYLVAWRELLAHWRAVLGERLLVLRYEDLVADFDAQVQRLLVHCGLDWEDTCRDFHRRAPASATHSAVQVSQPLYRSSVGRWRRHEAGLAPLLSRLEAAGIRYGS